MKKDEFFQYAITAYKPTETMLKMVPADKLDWKPGPSFMSMGQLICHLADGISTELQMTINNSFPKMEDMAQHTAPSCDVQEALAKLKKDEATLRDVLKSVTEDEFTNKIVSVPWGWQASIEMMALNFREHFTNHKMQLFTYLKLLGFPVNTETLYMG